MNLQDKTSDIMVSHAIEVDKYAISEKKRILSEFTYILNDIKKELIKGDKEVTLSELRSMQSTASKLFLAGSKLIKENMLNDSEELMVVELEQQVEMLQELISEYLPVYKVRTPTEASVKREIKNQSIKGLDIVGWLDVWETKTNNILKSSLNSAYAESKDRYDIIDYVFGESKTPSLSDTFSLQTKHLGDLSLSLSELTMAAATAGIANSNYGIIVGEQWNSCLCATTCASCASLHGAIKYYDGEDETDGNTIPLHPNCMCFWTYVYKDPKSMATQVATDQKDNITSDKELPKFQVWYNSISEQRKLDLFGTSRVRMLDEGTIKISQLVSSTNRRLYTLDELKNKGYSLPEK